MKYCFVLAIILALQLFQSTQQAPVNETQPLAEVNYRLPTKVKPTNYNIEITPYILKAGKVLKQFQFEGKVKIKLNVVEATNEIVLHVKDVENIEMKLYEKDTEEIPGITAEKPNPVTDFYTIKVGKQLSPGEGYLLEFNYTGNMRDDMKGFYYSKTDDNSVKYIGSTQFQTHHARRAFPCFDEPSFKATFDITINHEKDFKRIYSNTDPEGNPTQIPDTEFMKSVFKQTPKMSTYLVAFLISNFDGEKNDGFSVIARPQYKDQTKYSFEDGQKLLKALNEITGLEYKTIGIPKMDMAAIPDFSAGAMENWGLLTYRERGLLYDAAETTDTAQQSISLVIAHEQTHMWFGDLVTCDWWSHTWLNEGFARFFQYFAAAKVHTDWALDKQFVVDQIHSVFTTDSSADTHAMSAKDINTPADLAKMFGTISYNKGASIIRMFKYTMGEENFNKGIRKYLSESEKFEGISKPEILFKYLKDEWKENENLDKEKDAFFLDWTEKVGYPVVRVKVKDDRKKVEVFQERFLLEDAAEKDLKYTIPFTYTTQKKANFDIPKPSEIKFIKNSEKSTEFELADALGESDYLIANIEQIGYFRVMYEESMLHKIHHALTEDNFGKISEVNRAHLIDDLFNFARAGNIKYSLLFDILSYLEKEKHYIPLTAVFNGLKYIETRLGDNTDDLKTRVKLILPEVYKHLTFEEKTDDSRLDKYNRAKVLQWACKYEYDKCQTKATELFEEFKKDTTKKKINKNIRSAVYCSAIRTAENEKNYEFLEEHFKTTTIPTEKTLTLSALGCVKEKAHVEKYYNFILGEHVRKQDKSAALNSLISENAGNAELVFDLIEKDHEKLGTALGDGENDVATIVSTICNRFTTKAQKEKVEAFSKKLKDDKAKEKVEKAVKNIDKNLKWLETYKTDLTTSLRGGVAAKAFSAVLITFTTILCYITMY